MRYSHAVIGLGATGVSAARFLLEKGLPIVLMDTRICPPGLSVLRTQFPAVPFHVGGLDATLLNSADTLVLSPGISLREPLIATELAQGKPVIGDIELFAQAVTAPVVAITGTNAKSTVTTLVGEMGRVCGQKVAVGGNLGIPALDLLREKPDIFVLELSSFQLETIFSLQPQVACILNVTADHMDRYDSLRAYADAKKRIWHAAKTAVCNHDDPLTWCDRTVTRRLDFSLLTDSPDMACLQQRDEAWLSLGGEPLMPVRALPLAGSHGAANALAALAVGHLAGFSTASMLEALQQFRGLPHRCELVCEQGGVRWFNDSKGTNVGATLAALTGLGRESPHLVLIAGGVGKGADFSALLPAVRAHVKSVILLGEAASLLETLFQPLVPVYRADSMEEAVQQAGQLAMAGDDVLLSPACASLDMFRHFEHRGEVFVACVRARTG